MSIKCSKKRIKTKKTKGKNHNMNNNNDELVSQYKRLISNKDVLITIFILTRKRPFYLKQAMESILKQTYEKFVVVVIDNCSKDETYEIVKSFHSSKVLYIERFSETMVGNIKFAFNICETKYLVVFHDDDIVMNNYLNEAVALLESNINLVAVGCSVDFINENGVVTKKCYNNDGISVFKDDSYFLKYINHNTKEPKIIFPSMI